MTAGRTDPLTALELVRTRLRTRHYSYRTEQTYVDWVRRFCDYASARQAQPHPTITVADVRDFLTYLAVERHVSASSQNQACCALLFLCREVLNRDVEGLAPGVKAKRGTHLPVVLSVPETAALLAAMSGTPKVMASFIYGGGLRVSECCGLRTKDLDFDQGLIFVRSGKGDKDRATLRPRRAEMTSASNSVGTVSRHISCSTAWTSDRSRNTSDTPTSKRRWCTHTSSESCGRGRTGPGAWGILVPMTTRHKCSIIAIACTLAAATSGGAAQQAGFTRTLLQDQDLSIAGQHVVQARAEFQPGVASGRHTHPGEEIAYVLEGLVEVVIDGKPPITVKAGEPFFIPAGLVHEGRNIGPTVAKILATYVVEKGKPVSTPAK